MEFRRLKTYRNFSVIRICSLTLQSYSSVDMAYAQMQHDVFDASENCFATVYLVIYFIEKCHDE